MMRVGTKCRLQQKLISRNCLKRQQMNQVSEKFCSIEKFTQRQIVTLI